MFDRELLDIFGSIAEALLGASIEPWPLGPEVFAADALVARIEFQGGLDGVLSAAFSAPLATKAAALMLEQASAKTSISDMCDALGELVNIAAGNLKALLPSCQLSLPMVQVAAAFTASPEPSLGTAGFRLFGEPVLVSLRGTLKTRR